MKKSQVKKASKNEPIRMEFESYIIIRSLIEAEEAKLERSFQSALGFIPAEQYKHGQPSGIEKAHRIFQQRSAELRKAKEQLLVAAGATYKDHPNPEMRKFWCLPT